MSTNKLWSFIIALFALAIAVQVIFAMLQPYVGIMKILIVLAVLGLFIIVVRRIAKATRNFRG